MNDLIIIGAGGFGREVAWLVQRLNHAQRQWNLLGWIDDTPEKYGTQVGGYPVLGGTDDVGRFGGASIVCAIGGAESRRQVIERVESRLGAQRPNYATLIDPSVFISGHTKVGSGSIICAGSIVTVDVSIGSHVVVNLDCTIGHDAILDDYVTLYPGTNISGGVRLHPCVEMGTGAQIIQGVTVGAETIVGAGSTVVKDLPEGCTAVGSPARPIKFRAG